MREESPQKYWVDWYLGEELSPEDEAAFETALLESPELQDELEAALALRAALAHESEDAAGRADPHPPSGVFESRAGWQPMALAATVVLAVVSTVMWWKAGNDAGELERELRAVSQPMAQVLIVPVPIMRSAGGQSPDVIIQKPEDRAAIVLDIELGLRAREEAQLDLALVDPEGEAILAWQAAPTEDGRTSAVISSEQMPASRLWLQVSDSGGNILERRLLEFRNPD